MNQSVAEVIAHYEQMYLDTLRKIERNKEAGRDNARYFRRKSMAQASLKGLKMFVSPQMTATDLAKYMKELRTRQV